MSNQVDLSNVVAYIDFYTDGDSHTGKGLWIDWIQARQYDEQLVCGYDNLEEEAFKGLNISSIDPTAFNESALLIREGDIDSPLNRIGNTGTRWVRFLFKPLENNSYINNDMLERYDFMVDSLCTQGISVLGVVNHETIAGVGYAPSLPAYQEALADEAGMLARHFNGRITHWEVWNEPDLQKFGSPFEPDYVQPTDLVHLLKASYDEIKLANSRNKVISGGLFNARNEAHTYFDTAYDEIEDFGLSKAPFDYFGLHPYSNGRNGYGVDPAVYLTGIATNNPSLYDTALDPFLRKMYLEGQSLSDRNTKVWITELGWNSSLNDSDRPECRVPELVNDSEQAQYLTTGFDFLLDNVSLWNSNEDAVDKVFWYQFMDVPPA